MNFELKGWHVLMILLGFFGVTIGVNALFTAYALSTFSGEDVSRPYSRGLEYNKTLAARAAQAELKWKATIDVTREGEADALVSVVLSGADDAPRSVLKVEATLRRPTDAGLDRTITLDALGAGEYRASVPNVAPGQWDIVARATGDDGAAFEAERRVMLK